MVTSDWDCRQNRGRRAGRISNLLEGAARLAKFTGQKVCYVAWLRTARAIYVAELVQHRALLGENQQERKCQS
jgi:hypothetical protein